MTYITGLDLSLAATGIATISPEGGYYTTTITPPIRLHGLDRIDWLLERIAEHTNWHDGHVVVEGPAFGAYGRGQHERAGLWWIVARSLRDRRIPVAVAPPASVKKYATGKGNASKDAVLLAAAKRFTDFDGDNNAADALWLAAMGAEHLGRAIVALPAANKAALAGVAWPKPARQTQVLDLSRCSLQELRTSDDPDLAAAVQRVARQVERPRVNLGSSGPPGRAD